MKIVISLRLVLLITMPLFFVANTEAQQLSEIIDKNGSLNPYEKIHVHFDKESYMPGETIWYKAYLFEDNLPSEKSTNFYISIYDDKGRQIDQQLNSIFGSTTDGHFTIPDSIQSTQLICRAFTSWMLKFDSSFVYTHVLKIYGRADNPASNADNGISLRFFPEGGDVIADEKNTMAFKASYKSGLPYPVTGVLKKQENGEVIMPFAASHDGMGRFDIDIKKGEKVYAEWQDGDGKVQSTWLPEAKDLGVSLKLTVQSNKLYYNLVNKTGYDSLHILMYMYQKVFYKKEAAVNASESLTAMVPLVGLPSGIMQLTVFDQFWQPIAERVAFIQNNNYEIPVSVKDITVSTAKRGKNEIEVAVNDSLPANFSLSITDAEINDERIDNTIVSSLLLTSDLRGKINNPAYYFSDINNTVKADLDLVMLTNGWRRYNWNILSQKNVQPTSTIEDNYLSIYGQIAKEKVKGLESDEMVNLLIRTADSSRMFYSVKPEANGLIKQTGLVFYDSANVYYSFNKDKSLNGQMAFSRYNYTLSQPTALANYNYLLKTDTVGLKLHPKKSLFAYYTNSNGITSFNNVQTLSMITVKSDGKRNWRNDPLVKMDEQYATGLFAGGANSFAVDVLHDEKAENSLDIYNYLVSKVPGLTVSTVGGLAGGKVFTHRNGTVVLYLDGGYADNSQLQTLSVTDIAYIKFFGSSSMEGPKTDGGVGQSGFTPVLAVFRKKGDDLIDRRPKITDLKVIKVAGYSPIKEFYSPDYATDVSNSGTDARTTLLWRPYILTDSDNRSALVKFFNNDFTKKFRVVLEGINAEGKMIHVEKIIE